MAVDTQLLKGGHLHPDHPLTFCNVFISSR
jgi:hypothetical protein